ncbi:hypothetical protein [Microbacterium sp. TNHR37B]|uniref:hypothetical protein n=1 Tax=Microbacterium sp. TNHR37B TaxID=1775956 RepID=UPI0007B1B979|nr:hypothetical protein [Microbacterium sp. TNHR37B]KZE88682.1 hypothetical protein AVP41_03189 [Microbacterium sp. TNHR37B]
MTGPRNALSLTLSDHPDLPSAVYQALYRITGRSTVEMRNAVREGAPVYTAALFGTDHLQVVPRLEKAADFLDEIGLPFVVHEWIDGEADLVTRETMRRVLEATVDPAD